jgi:hypothetical protein
MLLDKVFFNYFKTNHSKDIWVQNIWVKARKKKPLGSKLVTRSHMDYFGKVPQVFFLENNFYMQMNFGIIFLVTCSKKYQNFPQCTFFKVIIE